MANALCFTAKQWTVKNCFSLKISNTTNQQILNKRQCTYITLWHICVTIVAMELQRCVPFFIVVIHVSVNNIKMFIVAMEM